MKLSIVVAVYNTVHTLEACVESVLNQGVDDYELILVDDGSEDGSAALCDQLGDTHEQITVVHQQHGGVSAARNKGIERAQGEYITFVDSDDSLGSYTLPILLARLGAHPDYDILEYPIVRQTVEAEEQLLTFGRHEYTDMERYWVDGKGYAHAHACNKIFRRGLFDHVRYPSHRLFGDAYVMSRLMEHCRLIATTEEGAYEYAYSSAGLSATADAEALRQLLEVHVEMLEHYGLTEEPTEYYVYVLNIQLEVYRETKEPPILPPLDSLTRRAIRRLPVSRKDKRRLRLTQLFGIKGLCKIHRLRHRPKASR